MLTCKDCGNTSKFDVGAIEYHRHQVDGNGDFVEDLGSDDVDQSNDYQCMECGSWNVEDKS